MVFRLVLSLQGQHSQIICPFLRKQETYFGGLGRGIIPFNLTNTPLNVARLN